MQWEIISFGSHKTDFINRGVAQYQKWIVPYIRVTDRNLPSGGDLRTHAREQILCKECEKLVQYICTDDRMVLLDPSGDMLSSEEFAQWIHHQRIYQTFGKLVFVIGGSLGFSSSAVNQAYRVISLSRMTMTHEFARLILYEQIYRAMKMINNEPYHY